MWVYIRVNVAERVGGYMQERVAGSICVYVAGRLCEYIMHTLQCVAMCEYVLQEECVGVYKSVLQEACVRICIYSHTP